MTMEGPNPSVSSCFGWRSLNWYCSCLNGEIIHRGRKIILRNNQEWDYAQKKVQVWAKGNLGKIEAIIRWWGSTIAELQGLEQTEGLSEEAQHNRWATEFNWMRYYSINQNYCHSDWKKLFTRKGTSARAFSTSSWMWDRPKTQSHG